MRWYLVGAAMLAACGFSSEDAMDVAQLLHRELRCPFQPETGECPNGGRFDRSSGTLTLEGCGTEGIALDGEGLAITVQCTQSSGILDVAGGFTTQDGVECQMDLDVRSVISPDCGGLGAPSPCETSWVLSGTVCGYRVAENCTDGGGFPLSIPHCQ